MMFRKVTPGDDFAPSAALHNATVDAVSDFRAKQLGRQTFDAQGNNPERLTIRARAHVDAEAFSVWKIEGVAIEPDTVNTLGLSTPVIGTADGDADVPTDAPCVFLHGVEGSEIGLAVIAGITAARINRTDSAHAFAKLAPGGILESTADPTPTRILWSPSGSGLGVVLIGGSGGGGGNKLVRFKITGSTWDEPTDTINADFLEMNGDAIESGALHDPEEIFTDLGTDDTGLAIYQGGTYYAIQAPCGDS